MKKALALCLCLLFAVASSQQYVGVSYKTADELVRDILVGSGNAACLTISNVSGKGWDDYQPAPPSYGYFEKGSLPFSVQKGVVLSTGSIFKVPGPNGSIISDGNSTWPGDPDLQREFGPDYLNATSLEFDFIASHSTGISFDYVFLSEEYNTGNCSYSDAFAFLIKKASEPDAMYRNIAVLPKTGTPVSSLNIKGGSDCPKNAAYFDTFNYIPFLDPSLSATNFEGQTKVLTASADVVSGEKYHIKLVIADHKNGLYDSAVFLKAGSFAGKKDLGPDLLISDSTAGCVGIDITINATTPGASSYQWYKDGVTLPGETGPTLTIVGLATNNGTYEVEMSLSGCLLKGTKTVEFADKPVLTTANICNYNNGNAIPVVFQDLNNQIVTNLQPYFEIKYFSDAAHLVPLPNNWSYTDDTTVYVQVASGNCNVVNGTVNFLVPKKSAILSGKIICPGSTTTLEVETGFQYYRWIREDGTVIDEGPTVNRLSGISAGKYSVELTSQNGCKISQEVSVTSAPPPQITHIEINGSTATVFVVGGSPPYSYSIDGINFQSSNVFKNVPRGMHTAYARDSENCATVEKEFLLINLINVITPNGDGINDVLDYSDLKIKENAVIRIVNRDGLKVFESADQNYIWDGKTNGRTAPTGNYWYVITWTEPVTQVPVVYSGWILLKNRK